MRKSVSCALGLALSVCVALPTASAGESYDVTPVPATPPAPVIVTPVVPPSGAAQGYAEGQPTYTIYRAAPGGAVPMPGAAPAQAAPGTADIVTGATIAAPVVPPAPVQTQPGGTGDMAGFPAIPPGTPIPGQQFGQSVIVSGQIPAEGMTQEQYVRQILLQQQQQQIIQQQLMAPDAGVRQFPSDQIVPAQPPQMVAGQAQVRPAQVLQQGNQPQPGQVLHPQVIAYPDDPAFGLPAPQGADGSVPVPTPSAFPSGIPVERLQTLTPVVVPLQPVPFQPMQIQPVQPGMPIQPVPVPVPEPVPAVAPVQLARPMTPEAASAAIGAFPGAQPMPATGFAATLGTPVAGRDNLSIIRPAEVRQALSQGVQLIILDVRDELVRSIEGNIAGDAHVQFGPAATFPVRVSQAIPSAAYPVVVYCSDGIWSSQAADVMARMGYRVYLMGAYPLWLSGR